MNGMQLASPPVDTNIMPASQFPYPTHHSEHINMYLYITHEAAAAIKHCVDYKDYMTGLKLSCTVCTYSVTMYSIV